MQLATSATEVPRGRGWVHEIKLEGYRAIMRIEGRAVRVIGRDGHDWTADLPHVVAAARGLAIDRALLDGELVVVDAAGRTSFRSARSARRGKPARTAELQFHAFDLLHLAGRDVTGLPLEERKRLLKERLAGSDAAIRYTDHVQGSGARVLRRACEMGASGIVSKRIDAPYRPGRGKDWLKLECPAERRARRGSTRDDRARAEGGRRTARPSTARGVAITTPDRILFAEAAITKRQLVQYYEAVAARMVPQVRDRPLMLLRCPEGSARTCFYQKHATPSLPEGMHIVDVHEREANSGKVRPYLYIADVSGLVAAAQIGALELHAWISRRDKLEHPDRLVLDLDPADDVSFAAVKRAALHARARLHDCGLRGSLMTTGGKGLHVIVPLRRQHEFAAVRAFARAIALRMVKDDPKAYVASAAKGKRQGRIFVDYLRNGRGATAICPYSPRARSGAPVATPVAWDELSDLARADAFSLRDVITRTHDADPWADAMRGDQRLTRACWDAITGAARR